MKSDKNKVINSLCITSEKIYPDFGEVYVGYFVENKDNKILVKELPTLTIGNDRFQILQESAVAQTISHENIARLKDISFDGDNFYQAMEFCNGNTLSTKNSKNLQMKKIMELQEAFDIFLGICEGYNQLFIRGIIHR